MDADRPTLLGITVVFRHSVTALDKDDAIAFVLCLVAKHHSDAELINMTSKEYRSKFYSLFLFPTVTLVSYLQGINHE